ncbi:uncharacterized protein [Choristoneura fumiferana]|uniref:uncharacterized protein n=1 Tax=Choristoneura fumiferana TaxID=7141 RepID=UPI003D15815A
MTSLDHNLCCGCLSENRKMVIVEEFWKKQCFLQIISEIPMCQPEGVPVWLCWECEALIRRFTEFKQQVMYSYRTLHDFGKQNLNLEQLHHTSKLTICKLQNVNITQTSQLEELTINQSESPIAIQLEAKHKVKEETENNIKLEQNLSDQDNDDNDLLINYVSKKKKVRKKKKKEVFYKEIELTEKEVEEERRVMQMKEEYVNAMFRCEKCLLSFPNADDLKDHVAIKHELNASRYMCSVCACSFSSELSYKYHAGRHRRRFQCAACGARARSQRAAHKHYTAKHGIEPISFENLKTEENGQPENVENTENNGKQESFPCELCAKTFRWKTSLRKHLETHRIEAGQKRRPYCEPCKMSFTTTSNLQKHVKTSSKHQIQLKLRKLKEVLPEDSTSPEKRQAHIEEIKCSVNEARQQFPCAHCGKRFQWRGNLLRHLHSHAARANGELVCKPCNRTFSSIATYKQHMMVSRAHVSEQALRHPCGECGRRFATASRLRDHVDWDHRQHFTHSCQHCPKVFKSHTSLYLHKQVVHKKDSAEHLCDHCGKPFPNHAKLRSHIIALHTSESPYKCTTCGARFSWHSCLSRHVRRVHKQK